MKTLQDWIGSLEGSNRTDIDEWRKGILEAVRLKEEQLAMATIERDAYQRKWEHGATLIEDAMGLRFKVAMLSGALHKIIEAQDDPEGATADAIKKAQQILGDLFPA